MPIALAAVGLSAHAAGSPSLVIDMLPEAAVRGAQVRLGQVAYVSSSDLALTRQLLALPLGPAPRAGGAATLERPALERWVRRQTGVGADQVEWRGSAVTHIVSLSSSLTGHEVVRAAREHLHAWLAARSDRALLTPVTVPADFDVPAGEIALRARPIDDSQPRSRMLVWVDIEADGRHVRTVPVRFDVAAYASVVTTSADVPAGAPLDPRSLAMRDMDLARLDGVPLREAADGQRLRRSVRAGQPLTAAHVAPQPAVQRGQQMRVRLVAGPVALERQVEVLDDGLPGQQVRVRLAPATEPITARVVGRGQLEIPQ